MCYLFNLYHKVFKLQNYGMCGNVLEWIENYLFDRQQNVVIDGFTFNTETTNADLPHGSV